MGLHAGREALVELATIQSVAGIGRFQRRSQPSLVWISADWLVVIASASLTSWERSVRRHKASELVRIA
jgi:hypothetical protein